VSELQRLKSQAISQTFGSTVQ